MDVKELELKLWKEHAQLAGELTDQEKDSISNRMRELILGCVTDPAMMTHDFESLKFGKLKSPDGRFRMLNWNLPYLDGTHKYFCFVFVKENKSESHWWVELSDQTKEGEKLENKFFTADKWLGALYYEVIPMDKKSKDTYTLLGWDGKDRLTTRKIVEVMTISGKKVKFGSGIFKSDDGTKKRLILEYSDEVSTSVKYFSKKQAIVFDHLSPKNPVMFGIFSEYGPDGTYDMLKLEKGKWALKENVDVKSFADDNEQPYFDPRKK